jgi:hypothetical protein
MPLERCGRSSTIIADGCGEHGRSADVWSAWITAVTDNIRRLGELDADQMAEVARRSHLKRTLRQMTQDE